MVESPERFEKLYANAVVAVDPVICMIRDGKITVLLQKREKSPFENRLELPGGLLMPDETAEDAVTRKLREFLGRDHVPTLEQFATFTEPKRDPRARTVTIGFVTLIPAHAVSDGELWHALDALPPLAFDHAQVIAAARAVLRERSIHFARDALPKFFPLNDLQRTLEVLEGKIYDNRNFRKQMTAAGVVVETTRRETAVSHRPALLYRFSGESARD